MRCKISPHLPFDKTLILSIAWGVYKWLQVLLKIRDLMIKIYTYAHASLNHTHKHVHTYTHIHGFMYMYLYFNVLFQIFQSF